MRTVDGCEANLSFFLFINQIIKQIDQERNIIYFLLFQVIDLIVQTNDTARQNFFLDTYIPHEVSMMFIGPTGTGKSAITNNYLVQLPKEQ